MDKSLKKRSIWDWVTIITSVILLLSIMVLPCYDSGIIVFDEYGRQIPGEPSIIGYAQYYGFGDLSLFSTSAILSGLILPFLGGYSFFRKANFGIKYTQLISSIILIVSCIFLAPKPEMYEYVGWGAGLVLMMVSGFVLGGRAVRTLIMIEGDTDIQDELLPIDEHMICQNCSWQNYPGDNFCRHCGSALEYDNEEDETLDRGDEPTCPICGELIQSDWNFCKYCGERLPVADQEE